MIPVQDILQSLRLLLVLERLQEFVKAYGLKVELAGVGMGSEEFVNLEDQIITLGCAPVEEMLLLFLLPHSAEEAWFEYCQFLHAVEPTATQLSLHRWWCGGTDKQTR